MQHSRAGSSQVPDKGKGALPDGGVLVYAAPGDQGRQRTAGDQRLHRALQRLR